MSDEQVLLSTAKFRVVRRAGQSPEGRTHTREVVEHPGSVTILPLEADGSVWLIRNFRLSVGQTLWELPAGTLDPGEQPEETARRELTEETGLTARSIRALGSFWMSPGILGERMWAFVAEGLTQGPSSLQGDEEIQSHRLAWDEAMAMIVRGEIDDAKTIAVLLMYDRFGR